MNGARPSATTAPSPTSIRTSSCRSPPPRRRPTRATRSRSFRPAQFVVRGGPVYAGRNGAPRELWQSELMWLPRVSAAWQLGTKAIVRGGYGIYYDTLNVMNSAVDQYGFSRTTNTQLTNDAGTTWLAGDPRNGISPLVDPFPLRADGTRFDVPVRDALGPMARVGQGFTFGRYDRQHPRVQRWRAGIQRELGRQHAGRGVLLGAVGRPDVRDHATRCPARAVLERDQYAQQRDCHQPESAGGRIRSTSATSSRCGPRTRRSTSTCPRCRSSPARRSRRIGCCARSRT